MHSFQSSQFLWQASRSDDLETEQTPRYPDAIAIFVATELRIRQIGDRKRHTTTSGVQTGNPPQGSPVAPPVQKVLRTDTFEPVTELQNLIRERAFELFVERGREDGHQLEDWLQAESEITGKKSVAA
jgi:hypothetical protein